MRGCHSPVVPKPGPIMCPGYVLKLVRCAPQVPSVTEDPVLRFRDRAPRRGRVMKTIVSRVEMITDEKPFVGDVERVGTPAINVEVRSNPFVLDVIGLTC